MNKAQENKRFMLEYYRVLSGHEKTLEKVNRFVADPKLRDHILFFEKVFPKYELIPDEMIAEDDRVFVRAHLKGKQTTPLKEGLPPTLSEVKTPFALCYKIQNGKIVDHWMIADQMELLEQLGLLRRPEDALF